MKLHYEFGCRQLNQHGEELCGDSVVFNVQPDFLTLVLADGLGHGVKANILATLTAKIASRMVAEGLPVRVVVETMSETLPVCAVRNLAYSTFTVAKFFSGGRTHLMEFDNPHVFVLRGRKFMLALVQFPGGRHPGRGRRFVILVLIKCALFHRWEKCGRISRPRRLEPNAAPDFASRHGPSISRRRWIFHS